MNLWWYLLRTSGQKLAIAVTTGAISGLCSIGLIALINRAISSSFTRVEWQFAGLAIVALISGSASRILLVRLSQTAIYQTQLRLSSWILASPLRHLEELGANRLLATITDDTQSISNAVFNIPFLCIDLASIAGCLLYLSWLSWTVFLFTALFLIIAIAIIQLFLSRASRLLKSAREERDYLFRHFRAMTDGFKELKLNRDRRKAFFQDELEVSAANSRDLKVRGLTILSFASSFGDLLFFVILGLLVFGLPRITFTPTSVLSGYVLTITYLLRPLQDLLEVLPAIAQANIALQKIDALGLLLASRAEQDSIDLPPTQFQQIQLKEVVYSYQQEGEKLFSVGPIDLTIYAGELVFIVGGNGSGKSTLAKLIAGLYVSDFGKIYVDGQQITDQNREAYRQLFAAVFADFFLFERLLGVDSNKLNYQAKSYLQRLELDRKVQIKDGMLSTLELSQGQRKRLALLTAYLEDRLVYLFDEWAADQDPYFREIFYQQILPELKQQGKTILVISHDDRYFHLADRLLKLEYGKIA